MGGKHIIISHPTGNSNVRALLNGLIKADLLEEYYTCIAILKNSILLKLSNYLKLNGLRKRVYDTNVRPYLKLRPFKETARLISQKAGFKSWIEHEKGIFCIDKVYRDLDFYISNRINNINGVYAYEDGALNSFQKAKSKGIFCLYDLPTGHWRAHEKYLVEEKRERPEWIKTFACFLDSKEKLARKDEELRLADIIFVASDFTKRSLELFPGALAPIVVIPYGFPPVRESRRYKVLASRKMKLLFVGNLTQMKGIANVFEAVEKLKNHIDLTIVGNRVANNCTPLEKELAKHTWIPSLPHEDVLNLMYEHDLLVFPSLFEGYGLVVTEAMSQGTPVITTNRTCGADFIKHGVNGWIVTPGNTLELENTLMTIIKNPECLESAGVEALNTASKLPMSIYGNKLAASIKGFIYSN